MTNRDLELLRRYRSSRPLRREILLAGMAAATFLLAYLEDALPFYKLDRSGHGLADRRGGFVYGEVEPEMILTEFCPALANA